MADTEKSSPLGRSIFASPQSLQKQTVPDGGTNQYGTLTVKENHMLFAQDGRNKDDMVDEVKHFKGKHVSPSLRSSILPYAFNINP